ncbi:MULTISPECIES: FAD-binding protein [unclassified Nostoc]|uniref:FAD-binding protein n=1 Tax=Nostoc sp. S13 TaxID=3019266 RepID=UPI0026277782|nr:FAD-binding protein [Nostoc sp. S13]MDF5737851.1 FAD-binding protein [Nostoc sp. S13]
MKLTAKKEDKELLRVHSENELELTADVLVIGGGPAAAWAAWAAASQGVKVIIVSLVFRHSKRFWAAKT